MIVTDYLAIAALIFWPVIPLFWIPVHFATGFFKKLGLFTYAMPFFTWLPLAYLIFQNRMFLISYKTELPLIVNIIGMILLIFGAVLHMWTAKLLGVGIIGVPEIFLKIKENIVTEGPFSLVRHPTYLSHTLIFSGVFFITGVIAVGILTVLDLIIITIIVIPLEEKELLLRFSGEYVQYKKKVPSRFFPWIH
jgi:protein-S-isoprenylcysteine O-methyltransferase Ste14